MKTIEIVYIILTAPIFVIGAVISFIGIIITGVGDLLMKVWGQGL
jgi:hypothetical protein